MKYKLVIFDLDGTILDTLEDLYLAVNFALKNNSLPVRSKEEIRKFVGNGIRLLIEKAVPENTDVKLIDKAFSDFKEYYSVHSMDNTIPYDGIGKMLEIIRKAGIKTAVVSNKADFAVQKLVTLLFYGKFDYVLGEKDGINKKPAPDMVYSALSALGISAEEAVYVGDSEVDIETAKNSRIDHIIVDWGFRDKEYLIECGAIKIVGSVNELLSAI